ncbi:MAG TPA: YfhO family protein, partial [bacterium]|nr:YfhO family protein [bacterium]
LGDLLRSGEPDGGGRLMRFGRDLPHAPSPLSSVLPPSTNVPYGLRDLQGYNALADRKLGDALETAWKESVFSHGIWTGRRIVAPDREAALEHPLMDALSVRAAVSGRPFRAAGWVAQPSSGFVLQRNLESLPRVRLVAGGVGVSENRMRTLLAAGSFDPEGLVYWVGEGTAGADQAPTGTAWVSRDDWNELVVRATTDAEALLVVADSWSDGWTATVDGAPAEILRVYGLVRGVVLPAGDHVVRMTYVPPGFRLGAVLSLLGLALAGTALAVGRGS